ncbi:UNVERIFIED_CONTAM: hypothetical protein Sradi_3016400 [Sesamum radiatum]|uniref:Uncharacterized protein n=1 Tax=Sesamum radiatum TaxID=300843 RepID=A0AAW2S3B5_SESRA
MTVALPGPTSTGRTFRLLQTTCAQLLIGRTMPVLCLLCENRSAVVGRAHPRPAAGAACARAGRPRCARARRQWSARGARARRQESASRVRTTTGSARRARPSAGVGHARLPAARTHVDRVSQARAPGRVRPATCMLPSA